MVAQLSDKSIGCTFECITIVLTRLMNSLWLCAAQLSEDRIVTNLDWIGFIF